MSSSAPKPSHPGIARFAWLNSLSARTRVLLFACLLPALAWGLAQASSARLVSRLSAGEVAALGSLGTPGLTAMTSFMVSSEAGYSGPEWVYIEAGLSRVSLLSLLAVGTGLVLVAWIHWAGRASGRKRERLPGLFIPCLYGTLLGAAFISICTALSLGFASHAFALLWFDRAVSFLPGLFAVGGLLAGLVILWSALSIFRRHDASVLAVSVSDTEQAALWAMVREISVRLHTEPPHNVILGLEPRFYVTEMDVVCEGRRLSGRTLHLSLAEARLFTPYELRAVIGHEMAHFAGEDTLYSRRFYPIYKGVYSSLNDLSRAGNPVLGIAQAPAVSCLTFFLESFLIAERALSRERELAADAAGASVAGRDKLASSLTKSHAYDRLWPLVLKEALRLHPSREQCPNLALLYLAAARANPASGFAELGEQRQPHPTDSHPPLLERLGGLQLSLEQVLPFTSLPSGHADSASALVRDCERLERKLSLSLLWPGAGRDL